MRYALVNGEKQEAQAKLKGTCPHCQSDMIARCGRVKVNHWAHKSGPECDHWWESETEWHRAWKNHFPKEWQEISHVDSDTGEKHIADVKNPFGLTIEFQHSPIRIEERNLREKFYDEMIWIVDGSRGKLDWDNLRMGLVSTPIQSNPLAYQFRWFGQSSLFKNWCDSKVKVFIDFGQEDLWRLIYFNKENKEGAISPISKLAVIEDCMKGQSIRVSVKDE